MNFPLKNLPVRTEKPRQYGLTMVMDKGMGLAETRDFLTVAAPYVDLMKLGFGTAFVAQCVVVRTRVTTCKAQVEKTFALRLIPGESSQAGRDIRAAV